MEELVSRLSALDPEASETLKVVRYFDALSESGAGHDALLRGAAVLSGSVVGSERKGRITRYDLSGKAVSGPRPEPSILRTDISGDSVWLERDGPAHANDEMIIERLAHALSVLGSHRDDSGAFAVAIDASRSIEDRSSALAQLRIEPSARIRLIATAPEHRPGDARSTVMPTRYGLMRASLDASGEASIPDRAGLGLWGLADHAPDSWRDAVIAYRLTSDDLPVLDADDLGSLLLFARSYDHDNPHRDVVTLAGLDSRASVVLRVLVNAESVRAAAAELGLHHSTLQAKHEQLSRTLGYDPRTTAGRTRYVVAEMLRRLAPEPR